ncbi:murein L,D-transpeptidase [Pedobacter alpinus]|uniref:Murein L,D-transpeptidase n=2 Tax=Pedobacter alpinus TaxID=1590643 RepID=A0ABW5TU08_9SPHI
MLTLLLSSFTLIGCGQPVVKEKSGYDVQENWDQSIKGSFSKQTELAFDSLEIEHFFNIYPQINEVKKDVYTFYSGRAYNYAWFENGKTIEQAGNLYNRIINLEEEGIYETIPYRKDLDSLFYSVTEYQKKPNILLELMLTAQYFAFSKLSWEGMDQSVSESLKWHLPRKKVNYEYYLDSLLKYKDLNTKEPVYRQYALLKDYLKKYKALDRLSNWNTIKVSATLNQGDTSKTITEIKGRLYLLEDYKGDTTNAVFDEGLFKAIKGFQKRNGLSIDGKIGPETIHTLNIPLRSRIRQIIVNMERNRWLPVAAFKDVLAVNIPDFKLHVFHADTLLWSCNVVVGQSSHPTTVFYGEVKYVVFRPYWNIPESIVRNEILQNIRSNSDYIATHDMEITGYKNGLPIIRQKPGANNSLGLVKFLFPNSYNTYLHDTPAKSLFGETSRAFSHGCIRVEEPIKLANFLLRNDAAWTPEKINSAMKSGGETYVTLKNKVPVFIAYFTAFVGQDEKLNFRKDIYDLDENLADMLLEDSKKD